MDKFGDRMKQYEKIYTDQKIKPPFYLCARIDGKKFSKYTKGFLKPFDDKMISAMIETTKALVSHTNADLGYVQSDEITLIFKPKEKAIEYLFDGKTAKLNSIFSSIATATFNHEIHKTSEQEIVGKGFAYFDCRSWSVPSIIEASNVLLWRVQDCKRNSTSALFRWTVGAKEMKNLNQEEMKTYLFKNYNVDWFSLECHKRYGVFVKNETYEREDGTIRKKLNVLKDIAYDSFTLEERIAFI